MTQSNFAWFFLYFLNVAARTLRIPCLASVTSLSDGAALEGGVPFLGPHDLFLLLVSVSFIHCQQVEFRAVGICVLPACRT